MSLTSRAKSFNDYTKINALFFIYKINRWFFTIIIVSSFMTIVDKLKSNSSKNYLEIP